MPFSGEKNNTHLSLELLHNGPVPAHMIVNIEHIRDKLGLDLFGPVSISDSENKCYVSVCQ